MFTLDAQGYQFLLRFSLLLFAVIREMSEVGEFERSEREFFDPTLVFQGQDVYRTETPETVLTEYPLRPAPDISIVCEKCKSLIPLIQLQEHRLFHKALTKLRYGNDEPKTPEQLLKRRNFILRKMKAAATKTKPVTPQMVEEVNKAYEYLKALLEGNYEELRQVREDVNAHVGGVALNCSPDCVYAVGMAASSNERWKSYMEDARSFQDYFGEDKHKCFFGLYDGYHGRFAAEVAANELHKLLLHEMMRFDPNTQSIVGGSRLEDPDVSHYKFERPNVTDGEKSVPYDESVGIIQNIINMCEDKYKEQIKDPDDITEGDSADEVDDTLESSRKKKKKSPFEQKMAHAFSKAYYLLDILLSYGKDENSKIRWSGCSAATCVIQDLPKEDDLSKVFGELNPQEDRESVSSGSGHGRATKEPPKTVGTIHVANSGNVHTVLVRGNRAYLLTKDHTPNNKRERSRVLKDGGTLSDSTKECRVNGVLLTTRGLGNHGDKNLKKCVPVEPHTTSAPIDQYAQFLIIATHGVWEVFSDKEAAALLMRFLNEEIQLLPSNQIPAPSKLSSTLRPLFDELNRPASQESIRKVSFSSASSPLRKKSAELGLGSRQRSGTLESVAESHQEDQSNKSSQGSEKESVKGQDDGKGHGHLDIENKYDLKSEKESDKKSKGGQSDQASSSQGQGSAKESEGKRSSGEGSTQNHSTPTGSASKNGSSKKKSRRYLDADMQTEIGSHHGDGSDDSGNEADIESYLENISFPGAISRISMVDGPPSREQLQRNLAQMMAQHLVQAALLAGAKDNVSAMVVLLPGCGL